MPRQDGVRRPAYLLNSGRTTTIQCTRSSGPGDDSAHFQEGTAARRLTTTISPHRGQRRQFPRFFVALSIAKKVINVFSTLTRKRGINTHAYRERCYQAP